jgi:hypothetical protein
MNKKLFLLLGIVFVTLFSTRAFANTNLTACNLNLNSAGETYDVVNDIDVNWDMGTCFPMETSNVTLDCHGYRIYKTGGSSFYESG